MASSPKPKTNPKPNIKPKPNLPYRSFTPCRPVCYPPHRKRGAIYQFTSAPLTGSRPYLRQRRDQGEEQGPYQSSVNSISCKPCKHLDMRRCFRLVYKVSKGLLDWVIV